MTGKIDSSQAWAVVLLTVVIITAGMVIGFRYDGNEPVEILPAPEKELTGFVQLEGEVNIPGLYPLHRGDTIDSLVGMAGGPTDNTDLDRPVLFLPSQEAGLLPQKIDINRAGAWLLEALPGIGEERAKAIIEYREEHGLFRSTSELIGVGGIGEGIYENIRHLVTVGDYRVVE